MSKVQKSPSQTKRPLPNFSTDEEGVVHVSVDADDAFRNLFNVETEAAAAGLMTSLLNALGRSGENYRDMAAAMLVELAPRDAIEGMLVSQMTATHVAMTSISQKVADTSAGYQVREAYERSMTRLSRTYIAQMDALKKHRAKAQQTVRVERVNVESGGQAIVGDVSHRGRVEHEK
jgi:hypothetical protein